MGSIPGTSSAGIEAPIEEVWAVVEDVLSAPDWRRGPQDMEELEDLGDGRTQAT